MITEDGSESFVAKIGQNTVVKMAEEKNIKIAEEERDDKGENHPAGDNEVSSTTNEQALTEKNEDEELFPGASDLMNAGSAWASWGSSWLQTAKDKTYSTYELVKKDLSEFSEVVHTEATHLASSTSTVFKEQAKNLETLVTDEPTTHPSPESGESAQVAKENSGERSPLEDKRAQEGEEAAYFPIPKLKVDPKQWMDNLVKTVNYAFAVEDTTEGEERMEIPITKESFDSRSQARQYAIQTDPSTFLGPPDGAPELFDDWLDHFDLETVKSDISDILTTNPQMRQMYAQLVPSRVSNVSFWQHYFYRMHQFNLDEARRQALLKRSTAPEHESIGPKTSWGDSDAEDTQAGDELEPEPVPTVTKQPSPAKSKQQLPPSPSKSTEHSSPAKSTVSPLDAQVGANAPNNSETGANSNDDSWSVCSGKEIEPIPDSPPIIDGDSAPLTAVDQSATDASSSDDILCQSTQDDPEPTTPTPKEKAQKNKGQGEDNEDWIDWDD